MIEGAAAGVVEAGGLVIVCAATHAINNDSTGASTDLAGEDMVDGGIRENTLGQRGKRESSRLLNIR